LELDLLPRPGIDIGDNAQTGIGGRGDLHDAGELVSVLGEEILLRRSVGEPAIADGIGIRCIAVEVRSNSRFDLSRRVCDKEPYPVQPYTFALRDIDPRLARPHRELYLRFACRAGDLSYQR